MQSMTHCTYNLDFWLLRLMFLACPLNNVLGEDGRPKTVDKGVAVLSSKSGRRGEKQSAAKKTRRHFPQIPPPRGMALWLALCSKSPELEVQCVSQATFSLELSSSSWTWTDAPSAQATGLPSLPAKIKVKEPNKTIC